MDRLAGGEAALDALLADGDAGLERGADLGRGDLGGGMTTRANAESAESLQQLTLGARGGRVDGERVAQLVPERQTIRTGRSGRSPARAKRRRWRGPR